MTTILAIQGDGWAVIGSDGRWSDEHGRMGKGANPKVFRNKRYLIGVAGDIRGANILQYSFKPPTLSHSSKGSRLTEFMVNTFIPAYRKCLEENGLGRPQYDANPAESSVEALVLANGVIFQIDTDYGIEPDAGGLYAAGSGGHYGLGALKAFGKPTTANKAVAFVTSALAICSEYDTGTGPPYHIEMQRG